jgi:predicted dehydrogenase
MSDAGRRVRVGLVGAGFAAAVHLAAYQRVFGVDLQVLGLTSRSLPPARALARQYGLPRLYPDYASLLADGELNVVDLCVPVHLHLEMAIAAARAGKQVICEKPLTGYVGSGEVPRSAMLQQVRCNLRRLRQTFGEQGVQLLYAENWIYAPPIRRAMELLAANGGTILDIRGHESHSGSASAFSKRWDTSGGGALLRLGIHPLTAAIHLKRWEGQRRAGRPILVREVYGQVADLTRVASFRAEERPYLVTGWHDVENWSLGVLTFDDDAVAVISASDIALGGLENGLEVYSSRGRVRCALHPNDTLVAYAPEAGLYPGVALSEKLETDAGWSYPSVDHQWLSGYQQELQDFAEAVAEGRPALSGLELAVEAIEVAYALYASAEQGRRLALADLEP